MVNFIFVFFIYTLKSESGETFTCDILAFASGGKTYYKENNTYMFQTTYIYAIIVCGKELMIYE